MLASHYFAGASAFCLAALGNDTAVNENYKSSYSRRHHPTDHLAASITCD